MEDTPRNEKDEFLNDNAKEELRNKLHEDTKDKIHDTCRSSHQSSDNGILDNLKVKNKNTIIKNMRQSQASNVGYEKVDSNFDPYND